MNELAFWAEERWLWCRRTDGVKVKIGQMHEPILRVSGSERAIIDTATGTWVYDPVEGGIPTLLREVDGLGLA